VAEPLAPSPTLPPSGRGRFGAAVLCTTLLSLQAAAQESPEAGEAAEAAEGDESKNACLESFGVAQRARRAGRLLETSTELRACAQAACPEIIAGKCTEWLEEVHAAIPSIVVVAKDGSGRDISDVTVTVDGRVAASRLDGRAIEVDPGPHDVVLSHPGEDPVSVHVVAVEGEKGRRVEARFGAPPIVGEGEPAAEPGFYVSPVTWVCFAVGGAATVAGIVTGSLALQRASDLEDTCGGTVCSESLRGDFDQGAALANASTATFVIGGVGLAAGLVTLFVLGGEEPADTAVRLGPQGAELRW
jgi:hypothetical protein